MDELHAAWLAFVDKAGSQDIVGGKGGAEFSGLGPLKPGEPGPRDVRVGSFIFFPATPRDDVDVADDAFLIAQSETRAFVVSEDGKLKELHLGGAHPVPFSLAEVLELATPFAGVSLEEIDETQFLAPSTEASMRASLGAKFDTSADLFGVPLLAGARAELEGRMRGSQMLMVVAVCLLFGIGLIAAAVSGAAMKLGVSVILGCIPVTLIVMGWRSRSKAQEELRLLPS